MLKTSLSLLFIGILVLLGSDVGVTQSRDELEVIKREVEALKKNQAALQKDLDAMKNAVSRRRPPNTFKQMVLNVDDDPFKGEKNAPLTVVDFSDYQ